MYLIDASIDPSTPVNRLITQEEWAKIFPGQVPRRVYYTFAMGKPVKIDDKKIADYLMKKYPTIRLTTAEIDNIIAETAQLSYDELKSYGLRYGWTLKDVCIKKDVLLNKILTCLRNYILPMTDEQYAKLKEERKVIAAEKAEREKEEARIAKENEEKELALEKKREKEKALAEEVTEDKE